MAAVSTSRRLTDADIAVLQSVVGGELPVTIRPYVEYATVDSIRNFARGYGDDNPLFNDEDYGRSSPWGTVVAPPLFPIATGTARPTTSDAGVVVRDVLRGVAIEVLGDTWTLTGAVVPGDRLERVDTLAAVDVEATPTGPTVAVTTRSTYHRGTEVVAIHDRIRRHGGRSITDAAGTDDGRSERVIAHYDDDQLTEIEASSAAWRRRGSARLHATDLATEQRIGPMVKGPLTVTDLVGYRGGVGPGPFDVEPLELGRRNRLVRPDFYDRDESGAWDARERLHYDAAYARRCGHPTAYDYTHTRLNWMVHLVTDWMGDYARVETISFVQQCHNYVGDTHWIGGIVDAIIADGDNGRVELSLTGVNQLGVTTCLGEATIVL
jgi:hypothetical protein